MTEDIETILNAYSEYCESQQDEGNVPPRSSLDLNQAVARIELLILEARIYEHQLSRDALSSDISGNSVAVAYHSDRIAKLEAEHLKLKEQL